MNTAEDKETLGKQEARTTWSKHTPPHTMSEMEPVLSLWDQHDNFPYLSNYLEKLPFKLTEIVWSSTPYAQTLTGPLKLVFLFTSFHV